ADEHDRAPLRLPDHRQAGVLGANEGAEGVDVEDFANVGGGQLFELAALPLGGTGDEDVEPAEVGEGLLHQVGGSGVASEIGLHGDCVHSELAEVLGGPLGVVARGVVVNGNAVAALGQGAGDVPADSLLAAAGHQGHA